ncbi:hypothetical protein C2E23DRAFT_869966 [Lenzites betulinus]|nr:hypothetical protein C2E23DRAFT_869966 [Lenzites betulinus]
MPARKICRGCNTSFTNSGYLSHLLQTRRLPCIRVRQEEEADGLFGLEEVVIDDNNEAEPHTEASSPQAFEGDYFGDYAPDDFDDFDRYQGDSDDNFDPLAGDAEPPLDTDEDPDDEDNEDNEAQDAQNYEDEFAWEAPPLSPPSRSPSLPAEDDDQQAHGDLRRRTFCVPFPNATAGHPLPNSRGQTEYEAFKTTTDGTGNNPYAPFALKVDWEFARWAKMRGPGSTAIPQLLGLSFKTSNELNGIIDKNLTSGRPRFTRREIIVAGEVFEVFYRDVLSCVRALFGDPEFAGLLVFAPECHYADSDHTVCVYFDMHTGKWWWAQQVTTIVPIIISSDKTQLTLFGSKVAYPVYMTIGNLPKEIRRKPSRRSQILLAYLPTTKLTHIASLPARRRALTNLYHACMSRILKPLRQAGVDGMMLASGDGVLRRGHPLFAVHIGDYPEQVLVVGCKTGECPKCPIPANEIGESTDCARGLRDFKKVVNALQTADAGPRTFSRACREAGIKHIQDPYWVHLPFVNIYQSITPDILHQLCQGVMKHLIAWIIDAYGAEEIDAHCRRFPPNHHVRLFLKGITKLQRVTGKEHADICRFLLGLVIGIPLPPGASPSQLVRAVRALLDFLYLVQYPAHTSTTLGLLKMALERFHDNKEVFVDLGIRAHFKIPKLHSLDHYIECIKLFGTTDNYDTQYTERLHIDFAKDAYRATNRKDEFPQMTLWLERHEKIMRHEACAPWCTVEHVKAVRLNVAQQCYGAGYLHDALACFIARYRYPQASGAEIEEIALGIHIRRHWTFPVFHKLRFVLEDAQALGIMDDIQDVAHVRPERRDKQGRRVPGRFDTVLVRETRSDAAIGMKRYCVGCVRMLFQLRKSATDELFPMLMAPSHLAYVEWFTAFTEPDPVHGMYKISRCRGPAGERLADVIEVRNILRSCHLYPVFGATVSRNWTSSTVLDSCNDFLFNPFCDQHMYMMVV